MPTKFSGQPLRRLEDPRLLQGQATFLEDLRLPGAGHVAFVRSIYPHARFRVDVSAARISIPAMGGVFVAAPFPRGAESRVFTGTRGSPPSPPPLGAGKRGRSGGGPTAGGAAETLSAPKEGAGGVRVKYEPLEPVPDARAAV